MMPSTGTPSTPATSTGPEQTTSAPLATPAARPARLWPAVVMLTANPDKHEELGRFQAIEGKTWNHPAVAHGCLFVRNAEEMKAVRYDRLAATH